MIMVCLFKVVDIMEKEEAIEKNENNLFKFKELLKRAAEFSLTLIWKFEVCK